MATPEQEAADELKYFTENHLDKDGVPDGEKFVRIAYRTNRIRVLMYGVRRFMKGTELFWAGVATAVAVATGVHYLD